MECISTKINSTTSPAPALFAQSEPKWNETQRKANVSIAPYNPSVHESWCYLFATLKWDIPNAFDIGSSSLADCLSLHIPDLFCHPFFLWPIQIETLWSTNRAATTPLQHMNRNVCYSSWPIAKLTATYKVLPNLH